MTLPYPDDPALPSEPNPYFQDKGFVRGDQQRDNNAQIWANFADLDSRATVLEAFPLSPAVYGLTLSNGTDAVNDINVAAGFTSDQSLGKYMTLASALAGKQLDAAWAVGANAGMRDTGAIADGTWFIFLIKRLATGVVDVLASLSPTAPTMPTNYTAKRRIGAILREGGSIVQFTQDGDYFRRSSGLLVVDDTNPGTSALLKVMAVPVGINVFAGFNVRIEGGGVAPIVYFSDPAASDEAPSASASPLGQIAVDAGVFAGELTSQLIRTNTAGEIRYRFTTSDGSTRIRIVSTDWRDRRGQDGNI